MNSTANPVDMAEGLASFLAARGLVQWAKDPGARPYDARTTWPTFIGPTMPARPIQLLCITALEPVQVRATIELPVQLRLRGAQDAGPGEVLALADGIRAAMQTRAGMPLSQVTLGASGLRVGAILPRGEKYLDDDPRRSAEYVMNYRLRYRVGQKGLTP